MATDKTGYVSVGAEIEDEVMPDRVIFSIGFGVAHHQGNRAWRLQHRSRPRSRRAGALWFG